MSCKSACGYICWWFCCIQGILVQIRAEIMSDTKARLGKHPDKEYEESAARNAFKRMEKTYGWDK